MNITNECVVLLLQPTQISLSLHSTAFTQNSLYTHHWPGPSSSAKRSCALKECHSLVVRGGVVERLRRARFSQLAGLGGGGGGGGGAWGRSFHQDITFFSLSFSFSFSFLNESGDCAAGKMRRYNGGFSFKLQFQRERGNFARIGMNELEVVGIICPGAGSGIYTPLLTLPPK